MRAFVFCFCLVLSGTIDRPLYVILTYVTLPRRFIRPLGMNQVLPDYILAVMLIVLLAATANRTLRKGIKSYNKETAAKQVGRSEGPTKYSKNCKQTKERGCLPRSACCTLSCIYCFDFYGEGGGVASFEGVAVMICFVFQAAVWYANKQRARWNLGNCADAVVKPRYNSVTVVCTTVLLCCTFSLFVLSISFAWRLCAPCN